MKDSSLTITPGGGFVASGPDAVNLVRCVYLAGAIKMWIKVKMIPTRGMTITRLLSLCHQYTGKKYKRSQAQQAVDDLQVWIDAMKAAMPTEVAQ